MVGHEIKSDTDITSRILACISGRMELTEIGKDCKKQIWSWEKSGAQFCDLEHKPNHVTSQLKSFLDARIKFKHLRIV